MEQAFYEARLLCDVMRPESSLAVVDGRGSSGSYVPLEVCIEESVSIVALLKSIQDTVLLDEENNQLSLPEFADNVLHGASTNFYTAKQQLTELLRLLQKISADLHSFRSLIDEMANPVELEHTRQRLVTVALWVEACLGKLNLSTLELVKDTYLTTSFKAISTLTDVKSRLETLRQEQVDEEKALQRAKKGYESLPPTLLAELQTLRRRKAYLLGALQNLK